MPFILLSLAFLLSGFTGWLLSKSYKVNENFSESIHDKNTNRLAVAGALAIGGLLLIIGLFMVFL